MKQRVSFFGVIALVSALMFPSHFLLAEEIKTDKANATESQETDRVIGKVTFLTGQAEMTLRDGTIVPLEKSVEIMDGSRIAVKDRSKVHLKMIDEGIEKLEANTTFDFNAYAYDPGNPQANRISKTIWTGEVTSKTGKGGEDFKDRYRLNSPLAAIAVLGTEYTVRVADGETQIVVHTGSISIAKLGGSCLSSGLGACAEGEVLSESQRGFALVVRGDLSKPKLTPVATLPPLSQSETPAASEEPTKEDDKSGKREESVKKSDTSTTGTKGTDSKSSTASTTTATEGVDEKKTAAAVTAKTESTAADKSTEAAATGVPSKTTSVATTTTTKTVVDERDPLADLKVKTTTTAVDTEKTTPPAATVPAATPVEPSTTATVATVVPVTTPVTTVAVVPTATTTTPSISTALPATPSTTSTTLESTGTGSLTGSGSTTTATTPALGGTSTSLLESASGSSTLTTPTGEVTPVVTSPPTVVPPPLVTAPTTPVVETAPLKVVEWGAHDPNATVDGSTTLSEQVNNNYKQVVLPNTGKYDFSMLENATAGLTDQRDATFMLSSYEAYMNNSATGTRTSAAVSNASLNVSPTRSTFDTQFNLSSPEYSGTVVATGSFSASNGLLVDDGSHPGTSISGIVGTMGSSIGAGYEFNHQINPTLNAGGALSFTGSHVGN
ncbi:MAG: FecR domain-containing protein [Candidatus Thiothrix putei]|uniref:FecR domain-containing protein n=1 Tax=Candidatus Thiothrix putei TaxID=3080811 RepID=A0AA95HE75_9GAMM|nr:MAG: FecR domain-containing protein [Candidatus Thiothrix putei]